MSKPRALEEALLTFPGTVLVISHDRWFLDRIATHILAYEGDSQVTFFEGNYTEYEEDRKKRLGGEIIPTRKISAACRLMGRTWPYLVLLLPPLFWAGNFIVGRAFASDLGAITSRFIDGYSRYAYSYLLPFIRFDRNSK